MTDSLSPEALAELNARLTTWSIQSFDEPGETRQLLFDIWQAFPALIAAAEEAVRLRELVKTKQIIIDSLRTIIRRNEDSPIKLELDRMSTELSKYRAVVEAAREVISPCEHERGFCIAHGTVRLPCSIGDLAAALDALDKAP